MSRVVQVQVPPAIALSFQVVAEPSPVQGTVLPPSSQLGPGALCSTAQPEAAAWQELLQSSSLAQVALRVQVH